MVRLSVIIPAYNEEKYLEKALMSIRRQTLKDFEIIVKDGGSDDRTVEIARKYADKVVSERDVSIADARNQGAKYAEGDILVFVDADTELPPDTLERLARLVDEEGVVGVSCRKMPKSKSILDRILYEFVNISTFISALVGIGGAHGNCMLIRKDVFERIGGFNPKIKIAEEQELVRKARKFGHYVFFLDAYVIEGPRRVRKWGRLKLYGTWFLGTIRSFKPNEKRVYEKVR